MVDLFLATWDASVVALVVALLVALVVASVIRCDIRQRIVEEQSGLWSVNTDRTPNFSNFDGRTFNFGTELDAGFRS